MLRYSMFPRLVLLVVALAFCQAASGATVRKIMKKKKVVIISGGKKAGLKKKEEVCFYDKKGVKVTCGKVVKVKSKIAYVKVKKNIKKIRKGYTTEDPSKAKALAKDLLQEDYTFAARILYPAAVFTPNTFNKVSYLAPAAGSTPATLWDSSEAISQALLGAALEGDLGKLRLKFAFRFRYFRPHLIQTDYDPDALEQYVDNEISATAIGGYVDYYFKFGSFRVGLGIDADMATVSFTATQKEDLATDTANILFTTTSSTTIVSVRIPLEFEFTFGKAGVLFGAVPMVPLVALGTSFADPAANDPNTTSLSVDPAVDLETSLGHGKASFGLDVIAGFQFAF